MNIVGYDWDNFNIEDFGKLPIDNGWWININKVSFNISDKVDNLYYCNVCDKVWEKSQGSIFYYTRAFMPFYGKLHKVCSKCKGGN